MSTSYVILALLVTVGVLRPILPDPLRTYWVGIVVTIGLAASLLFFARARALWGLFALVLVVLYLQPARVGSDGIFYYTPLRSLVVDFDLDFENEYRALGAQEGYFQRTATGRLPNNYSIGPAIAWSPVFLLMHALAKLGLFRPTGYGYPYFTAIATATAFYGFAGVLATFALARKYVSPRTALLATALLWLGSFHFWYMAFEPSMSHAMAMAAVSVLLLRSDRGLEGEKAYALAGALSGLVLLMRWQNALFVPVALVLGWARARRPTVREILVFTAMTALVFLPQVVYWRLIYGDYLLIPQGSAYIEWTPGHVFDVLFSSRHGLFAWTPLVWLGAAGLLLLLRREPVLAGSLLVVTAMATLVNASLFDWWAGASFSARRFDGALPGFALGLAVILERLAGAMRKHPVAAAGALLAPFLLWNWILMGTYASGAVPMDGPVSFRQAAGDGLEILYRLAGYPFSLPGAIRERSRAGVPLVAYDLAGARAELQNVDVRMGDTDSLFLGDGWSLPRRRPERTFRDVAPRGASLHVSLKEPAPYRIAIEASGDGEATIVWNGAVLETLPIPSAWSTSTVAIPAALVRAGMNELTIRPGPDATLRVSRVTWTRPGVF